MTQAPTFSMLFHIEKWADGTHLQYIFGDHHNVEIPYIFKSNLYYYFALRPDNQYHLIMTSSIDLAELQ